MLYSKSDNLLMLILFLCNVSLIVCVEIENKIDGLFLGKEINKVKENIGFYYMQGQFNNLQYHAVDQDGTALLKQAKRKTENLFMGLSTQLKRTEETSDGGFHNSRSHPLCCNGNGHYKHVPKFRMEVDVTTACVTKPLKHQETIFSVGTKFLENYNKSTKFSWQYYTMDDGTGVIFPSPQCEKTDWLDNILRTSYLSLSTKNARDIVIVIDNSRSMRTIYSGSNTIMSAAQNAVIDVIYSLNQNDRVAVLPLIQERSNGQLTSCYESLLAFVTPASKLRLKTLVYLISIDDNNADYEKALRKAFSYFNISGIVNNVENRDQIILFLSHGESSTGRNPAEVVKEENAILGNSVSLIIYGIGSDLSASAQQTLKDMVNSTYTNVKNGYYKDIVNPDSLRTEMESFYLWMDPYTEQKPRFTLPYVDPFSQTGLIMSMCIPIRNNAGNSIICGNIDMTTLYQETSLINLSEMTYVFMVDGMGRTLIHPLLPDGRYIRSEDEPTVKHISNFERSRNVTRIIESMMSGGSGNETIQTKVTISRGNVVNDGVIVKNVNATYYWAPIVGSNFSLCLVLGSTRTKRISDVIKPNNNVFLYHDRRFLPDNLTHCSFYGQRVTIDKSVIKFSPSAFEDPIIFINRHINGSDALHFRSYFSGSSDTNPGFKADVRPYVYATFEAELFWKKHKETVKYVGWRYIASKSGFIRIYPGFQFPEGYDVLTRTWYIKAMAQPTKAILTTPYDDAGAMGVVITLAQAISGHTEGDAVIATDFPLEYFHWIITKTYPYCKSETFRCIVIDDSGFIVTHPEFEDSTDNSIFRNAIHITKKENYISADLTKKGILIQNSCQDFQQNKERFTFSVKEDASVDWTQSNHLYEMKGIAGTNVFIIHTKRQITPEETCCEYSPDDQTCEKDDCKCLCSKPVQYNVCQNTYQSDDASNPCTAILSNIDIQPVIDDTKALHTCYDPLCQEKRNETTCFSVAECSWCTLDENDQVYQNPCCRLRETCPFGKTKRGRGNICDVTEKQNASPASNSGQVVWYVVAGVVSFIIVIIGIVCFRRRYKLSRASSDPYIDVIPEEKDLQNINPCSETDGARYSKPVI